MWNLTLRDLPNEESMKTKPAPQIPGETPWENLDRAFRTILTIPKEALLKEETRLKKLRAGKRAKKPS